MKPGNHLDAASTRHLGDVQRLGLADIKQTPRTVGITHA